MRVSAASPPRTRGCAVAVAVAVHVNDHVNDDDYGRY
jgi:hypothetical protein